MKDINLLGIIVHPLTIPELNEAVGEAILQKKKWIIANHNLHSIYLYHSDPKMRKFYQKSRLNHIDGMPLVYLARFLGYPLARERRVTYVDWTRPLVSCAAKLGWRIFYLGSKPGIAERGAEILRKSFPKISLETHHGYFKITPKNNENKRVIERINKFQPDLLMVGMGMPRQEYWIVDNLHHIHAHAILNCGACFDYVAGDTPTPPRWAGYAGLEWVYRLLAEPKRLGFRYLVEPWNLLPYVVRDVYDYYMARRKRSTQ